MNFNIEIAKVLDKHLPANGAGTEREKLRMELMAELLTVVNKLPIHSVSQQRELLLAYEEYTSYKVLGKKTDRISKQMVEDFLANNCG